MSQPVDVLVVGGGPVGVTTALLMARRGLSVRVLERATEIYDLPRAIVMDDEIQRVFQGVGLIDELREITTPGRGAEFVSVDGHRHVGIELPLDASWPLAHHPIVTYHQPQLEAWLRASAVAAGVELRLGVEVGEVSQDAEGVSVGLVDRDVDESAEPEIERARWLVACDGASSGVRKQLGIPFVDQGFDQDWLVVDALLTRDVPDLPVLVQQVCDPARPTTIVPGHDRYRRWELQLQPGETRDEMTRQERVWELLAPWLTPADAELSRAVVYRFHATVAERMREGRVFLAGDAAHQMPPFLGQGLCSGIRDAANLAWKLPLVASGVAGDSLLDTYGEERLPHSTGVVAHAVDTGRLIDRLAGRETEDPGIDSGYGGGRPFPHLEHGLRWGDHPAVGRQLPQPSIDGELLDERLGEWFAVIVDDPATVPDDLEGWAGPALPVVVPPGTLDGVLPAGGAVVVRPDRYVAAVADRGAALQRCLDDLGRRIGT